MRTTPPPSSSPLTAPQQAKADTRAEKEKQDEMDRIARANRRQLTNTYLYSFERIGGDDALKARLAREEERKKAGGGVSEEDPAIIDPAELSDLDGVYKVYDEKDGKRILVPDVLLYVEKGVVSVSRHGEEFDQRHADMLIEKAMQMGKELILQVGSVNHPTDWKSKGIVIAEASFESIKMMIKAADKRGEPYQFGSTAMNLLQYIAKSTPAAKYTALAIKYLEMATTSAEHKPLNDLVSNAAKESSLTKQKDEFAKVTRSPDSIDVKIKNDGITDEKGQLNAVEERLKELETRAEAIEPVSKELKASAEGAEQFLDKFNAQGAALFKNPQVTDNLSNQEKQLNRAQEVLDRVKRNFENAGSPHTGLHAEAEKEYVALKAESDACKKYVADMRGVDAAGAPRIAHPDPAVEAKIKKLTKQTEDLDKRLDAMKQGLDGTKKKADDVNKQVDIAQDKLKGQKDDFKAAAPNRPRHGLR